MSKKRILAHFMHEHEQSAARNVLLGCEMTDAFAVADAEDEQIDQLRKQGLVIQVLPERRFEAAPQAIEYMGHGMLGGGAAVNTWNDDDDGGVGLATAPTHALEEIAAGDRFQLQIAGPLLTSWRLTLQQKGVEVVERLGPGSYSARVTGPVSAVRVLPFVESLTPFPRRKGPQVAAMAATHAPAPAPLQKLDPPLYFDARIEEGALPDVVEQWLLAQGAQIVRANAYKVRFSIDRANRVRAILAELQAMPEVEDVVVHEPPTLHNECARPLLGIERRGPPIQSTLAEDGTGEIVGVADTGIDETHPDFQGRILHVSPLGRENNASDPHGHGTHVAGSVLGSGSNGRSRGVAPKAQLVFQSLLDPQGGLGGLPLDLGDLFEAAYQLGARVHNNSWGALAASEYRVTSLEIDRFVARRRDMLVVISAGNAGTSAVRRHADVGFVDWLSIGSPATCKNALTVGASRSDRTKGGYAELTYGEMWPTRFPHPPIASDRVSGDAEELAGFSSRGPCTDRRIKPDLVAPGTDICSARSVLASPSNFAALDPDSDQYGFMSGTSMAAPLVAGCAVLVRQHYRQTRKHIPSAALIKATLINGARKLSGPGSLGSQKELPNYHQGFGVIDMRRSLPNTENPWLRLEFIDPWRLPVEQFDQSGRRRRYEFDISTPGLALRACLVWTDPPGRALQNNLDLLLEVPGPDGVRKIVGNADLPERLTATDPGNNVEVIRLDAAPSGHYFIQVTATNLLHAPQDFALVVTGAIPHPLVRTF